MKHFNPSPEEMQMAKWLRDVIAPGGKPRTFASWDEAEEHFVDVTVAEGFPQGATTISTLSLHRHPNTVGDQDIRCEIIAIFNGNDPRYTTIVGSAGINVAKDSWPLWPGVVYPGIVDLIAPGYSTPHLMFTAPGTFPELNRYEMTSGQLVHWLQAIPIHESERLFLQREGLDALEDALEGADAQIGDLDRPPVV